MGYVPPDARWFIADLILEFIIEEDHRNVVHVNIHLIEARTPDQAYQKALDLGKASEQHYVNTDGKQVQLRFRGLRDLNVIHDELEDGAELIYEEIDCVSEDQIQGWIKLKHALGVFAPMRPRMS